MVSTVQSFGHVRAIEELMIFAKWTLSLPISVKTGLFSTEWVGERGKDSEKRQSTERRRALGSRVKDRDTIIGSPLIFHSPNYKPSLLTRSLSLSNLFIYLYVFFINSSYVPIIHHQFHLTFFIIETIRNNYKNVYCSINFLYHFL